MSTWFDRLSNDYVITLGEGSEFRPKWMLTKIKIEYNLKEFSFPNVDGSLVKRGRPLGRRFELKIVFQGDDHLTVAERFEVAARVPEPWSIVHPLNDTILVQPRGIVIDQTKHNVSEITGEIIETITEVLPRGSTVPQDQIVEAKVESDELAAEAYETNVETITAAEAQGIDQNIDQMNAGTTDLITTDSESFNFFNTVLDAKSSIVGALGTPINLLRKVQSVINFPFQVINEVRSRVNEMISQFNRVVQSLQNVTESGSEFLGLSNNEKAYYEAVGSSFVSSICAATVVNYEDGELANAQARAVIPQNNQNLSIGVNNQVETVPQNSYASVDDVDFIIDKIVTTYNDHITRLNAIQSEVNTEPDSFVPNDENIRKLQEVVVFTVSNLLQVVFANQIEQVIELDRPSNIVVLSHELYGPNDADANIQRLIDQNNWPLEYYIEIPAGKRVKFYKE